MRLCHPREVDSLDKIAGGAIAFLWPQANHHLKYPDADVVRGFVQRDAEGVVLVRGLDETPLKPGPIVGMSGPSPRCIAAATEYGGALLTGMVGRGRTRSFGGGRASVLRFRTHTLVAPVDLASLNTSRVRGISAYFPGALSWAGEGALGEEFTFDPKGKLSSVKYVLGGSSSALMAGNIGPLQLEIEPHWKSSGDRQSTVTIDTSLEVRVTSVRARDIADFIPSLLGVQDFLSLAHDRLMLATGGNVTLAQEDAPTSAFWQKDLMAAPSHLRAVEVTDPVPLVKLGHVGGPRALTRWLRLTQEVPEAVAAMTAPYRRGIGLSPGLRLQEVAGSIEYYVNMARARRGVAWAKKGNADSHAHALAKRVGQPFSSFVGDPKLWANSFLSAYTVPAAPLPSCWPPLGRAAGPRAHPWPTTWQP